MKKTNVLSIMIIQFVVASCGNDNPGEITMDSSGFPQIEGTYSLTTEKFKNSCSKSLIPDNPPISLHFNIRQNSSVLALKNMSLKSLRGLDKSGSSRALGEIKKDLSFYIEENASGKIRMFRKNMAIKYKLNGRFSNVGWNGTYTYIIKSNLATCTITAKFNGEKKPGMTKAPGVSRGSMFLKGGNVVNYDDIYGKVAASLGI